LLLYILDSAQSYCFFNNSLSHVSLAVNRLFATVLFRFNFFTNSRTVSISIVQHFIALTFAIVFQYFMSCCRQEFEYSIFNFRTALIDGVPDDTYFIKLSIKATCSLLPFIIYCSSLTLTRRRKQELKYSLPNISLITEQIRFAAQFALIAVLYTLSWLLFTVAPSSTVS
ncbi:hypothetical protein PMAYCL1PPCAC_16950, partial [Pristionchus mayeri]